MFNGQRVAVDFDFGFDWHYFNFCLVKEMGEPRFTGIRREADRIDIFRRTAAINHYSVDRHVVDGRTEVRMINHGIEAARVAAVKGHNVETMKIEELRTPAPNRAHEQFDKTRKTVQVYRPKWGDQR